MQKGLQQYASHLIMIGLIDHDQMNATSTRLGSTAKVLAERMPKHHSFSVFLSPETACLVRQDASSCTSRL